MTSKFRSGLEKDVANLLTELGVTYEYESTKIAYQISHNYCPDFVLKNGVLVETKGHFSQEDRRKMVAVKTQHPDLDIRLCFQNAAVNVLNEAIVSKARLLPRNHKANIS